MENTDNQTLLDTERILSATPQQVFAAFEQPELLAAWWGPAGFTNTFEEFEFEAGGNWKYVMHSSDGKDYPNESVFREIERDQKVVIYHTSLPIYTMTITLSADGDKTLLKWRQVFENETFAAKMVDFLKNAGEENLDRLEAVLAEN